VSVAGQNVSTRFEDHAVSPYQGYVHLPHWIQHGSESDWRDEMGKRVDPPEVNFAGKYFVAAHSCGTGCRYYTLTDLSSGRELDLLDRFTTSEPPPKTLDGHEYLTILHFRPDSKMLVAQYHIDTLTAHEQCRERAFLLMNRKLSSITKTARSCSKF